ncbi:uncharacterized protein LOC102809465 [Saccoglossus kowalevskii]
MAETDRVARSRKGRAASATGMGMSELCVGMNDKSSRSVTGSHTGIPSKGPDSGGADFFRSPPADRRASTQSVFSGSGFPNLTGNSEVVPLEVFPPMGPALGPVVDPSSHGAGFAAEMRALVEGLSGQIASLAGRVDHLQAERAVSTAASQPEFLADYGMVWVGKSSPRNEMYDGSEFLSDDDDGEDDEMWRPGKIVTDRRDVFFEDKRRMEHFPGVGQMLGGDHKPSILVPSRLRESQDKPTQITSQLPGPQLTVEQFLTKLPLSVVKSGKVIDVRHSVGDTIKGERGQVETTVIETQALKEMKDRVDIAPSQRPKSSKDVATLRIKGESGDKVFVLKMKFNDTIGDVRKYVDKHRTKDAAGYDILTTFPNKVYCNEMATLEECGLTPNATLHLRPIKKR